MQRLKAPHSLLSTEINVIKMRVQNLIIHTDQAKAEIQLNF